MSVPPGFISRDWPFAAPFASSLAQSLDSSLDPSLAPCLVAGIEQPVLVIGNFDGVHLGHKLVLAEARALASRIGKPLVALTFEPHPRDVFTPAQPVFRLTNLPQKAKLLAQAGADVTLALDFNAALSSLSAAAFIDELLIGACRASGVVVGHDFHFGKGRAGTPEFLSTHLQKAGITCLIVPPQHQNGELLSSRAIRAALEAGDIAAANAALGRQWAVSAIVEHGDKRGRELGFPTANLHLPVSCRLRHGIYAVRATVEGTTHNAIASFGRRPTFDDGRPKLEVMLFDFAGDLYGKEICVEFVAWIRGEERFDSVDALILQMNNDCDAARVLLEARA